MKCRKCVKMFPWICEGMLATVLFCVQLRILHTTKKNHYSVFKEVFEQHAGSTVWYTHPSMRFVIVLFDIYSIFIFVINQV